MCTRDQLSPRIVSRRAKVDNSDRSRNPYAVHEQPSASSTIGMVFPYGLRHEGQGRCDPVKRRVTRCSVKECKVLHGCAVSPLNYLPL